MSHPRILVTEPIPEKVISYLNEFGDVEVGEKGSFNSEEALIQRISDFDAILCMLSTPISKNVLQHATSLKVISNFAVGYNNIDVEAASTLGIKVANTPDVLTEACGDFAMALLMATSRSFYQAESYLRAGEFKGWEPLGFLGMELRGKTLGILGMGRIGQAFAHRAKAFGMNIIYHNRTKVSPEIERSLDCILIDNIEELARRSDVLSLNCPLTKQTHHIIDEKMLSIMPNHSILINISRGPVVDEAALADALHSSVIAGAGLDVFEFEPDVHPQLLSAPNCTMLPHIASATFETRDAIGMLAAKAIKQVLSGSPDSTISNLVNG